MNYNELNKKLGGNEVESNWRQASGGGWIHRLATVENEANVRENAAVCGDARVSGDARVYGNAVVSGGARVSGDAWVYGNAIVSDSAWVSGDAWVSGNAQVSGGARVYGNAWVYGDAVVYGNARVSGNAQVSGDARVSGDAWEISPLFIVGSRYSLTNAKHGHIQIGCELHTFSWWKEHGADTADKYGFTPAERDEYSAYIDLFIKIGK